MLPAPRLLPNSSNMLCKANQLASNGALIRITVVQVPQARSSSSNAGLTPHPPNRGAPTPARVLEASLTPFQASDRAGRAWVFTHFFPPPIDNCNCRLASTFSLHREPLLKSTLPGVHSLLTP